MFQAALCLAAGDAGGLYLQPTLPVWPLLFVGALVLSIATVSRHLRPGALAACVLAGIGLGLQAGGAARGGCAATLRAADPVRVHGFVRTFVPARSNRPSPGASPGVRLTVERAVVSQGARRCAIDRLVVRARSGVSSPIDAGSAVELSGKWRPLGGRGRWPRANDRAGFVSAAHVGKRRAVPPRGPPARLRAAASQRLRVRLPADVVPVARALILAEKDELPTVVKRTFAAAGLAHLLAISGLHVGILAAGLTLIAGTFSRRRRHAVAAVAAWAYVCAIGLPASAVRASILFSVYAVSRVRGRPLSLLDAVGWAAAVLLVARPIEILNPGFQLSFAGFLGLIAGAAGGERLRKSARVRRWLRRHPTSVGGFGVRVAVRGRAERALTGLAAGIGAFAATAPIAAAHFQQVVPVSVVGHVAATPLVALALWALAGVVVLPSPVAEAFAGAATLLLRLLTGLASSLADVSFGHTAVGPPTPAAWVASVALILAVHRFLSGRNLSALAMPVAAAVAVSLVGPVVTRARLAGRTLLCTLDVGQGDAAVVRTSSGGWMVFDAGPAFGGRSAGREVIVPFMRARAAHDVDLFVLSHPDLDHVGGAADLFSSFRVRRVMDAGVVHPRTGYLDFLDLAAEGGARWFRARQGAALRLDNVTLTVLGPARDPGDGERPARPPDANASSVAFRLDIGGVFAYVNTGDASDREERTILSAVQAGHVRAQLLKIGHHGSQSSTSDEWIAAVAPTVAVVSVGADNRYGHPHPAVLETMRDAGVPHVWRTDRDGTLCVVVERDGSWRWGRPDAASRPGVQRP